MCAPDIEATFALFDRVVNVRLGTGVPIGTRGTIVGIMLGRNNLDTYYEVLFDNLPSNSLDAILLGKNQQKCRIKVRSYHLLNYSHALRLRSMNNQQQTPIPWRQHSVEQTSRSQHHHQQQQARVLKNESDQKNTSTKPKSAPPLTTHDQPYFAKDKEQKSTTDTVEYPTSTLTNVTMSTETILPSCPSNSASGDLFYRAIQDSEQIENSLQQTSEPNLSIPFQSSEPLIYPQQTWEGAPSQYFQNPSMSFILFFSLYVRFFIIF